MSKFIGVIVGGLEIAVGTFLVATGIGGAVGWYLIAAGAGQVLAGIGTLLAQGPLTGVQTLSRNSVAPWNVVYGRAKVGGICVYIAEFGNNNEYLDMVCVLASHPCRSVDALLLDGIRVPLDANGCSFTPTQQTVNIASVTRANDTVTVVLTSPINYVQTGDSLEFQNISDNTFNGRYAVTVFDPTHFTYICGGTATTVTGSGQAVTTWPDYQAKIHMEVLLGNHTETFPGMLNGTPNDGDAGNLVTNPNSQWTADHRLLGKTCAFIRWHYSDQVFANGIPTIAFRLSGKQDIYDPRPNTALTPPSTFANVWNYAYFLQADVPAPGTFYSANTPGNVVTVYYADYTVGAQEDSILAATFNTGKPTYVYVEFTGGAQTQGPYIVKVTSIGLSQPPGNPHHFWYFTYEVTGAAAYTYYPGSGNEGNTASYTVFPNGYGYTENAALCIADYLANQTWGFKAAYGSEIPLDRLISAANICDEAVPIAAGGTEPRYTCNGGFPLTMKRGEVLQNLLTSCAGRLTYTQGQFTIWPGAWQGASLYVGAPGTAGYASTTPQAPALAGQSVTWATAGSTGVAIGSTSDFPINAPQDLTGQFGPYVQSGGTAGKTMVGSWNASATSASLSMTTGSNIPPSGESNCIFVTWSNFQLPTDLPADAVITAIHAVADFTASNNGQVSEVGVIGGSVTGTTVLGIPTHTLSPGVPYNLNTTSLAGISLSAVVFQTLPGAPEGFVNVNFIGLAVYYTSEQQASGGGNGSTLSIGPGPFRWREKVSIRDLYNGVKGTYISPANNWQASDIPPYAQDQDHGYTSGSPMYPFGDANLYADGGDRRWLDIQLPFTISVAAAQRLCKIELMRRRQQGTGTFSYNMALYRTTALDIASMTFPLLGWTNKLLEIAAHRFTITKQSAGGEEVTLLGTEIDVQETDPSIYDWSTSEELTAAGYQQASLAGSSSGGGSTLVSYATYQNTPSIALSQPSATSIAMAAVSTAFPSKTVTYSARTFTIPDPGSTPTWYYITIADSSYSGDGSPQLAAYAETTTAKVGLAGYTYIGAIQCTHAAGGSSTPLPGGWPAPQATQVGS